MHEQVGQFFNISRHNLKWYGKHTYQYVHWECQSAPGIMYEIHLNHIYRVISAKNIGYRGLSYYFTGLDIKLHIVIY